MIQAIVCFSHLGWNFVYQRPQHLLSRFAEQYSIYYFEEPRHGSDDTILTTQQQQVTIVQPFITEGPHKNERLSAMVSSFITTHISGSYIAWYYTPMALEYTAHLQPAVVVYDSMDELSAFKFAPPAMLLLEDALFEKADIVFTGGTSLYQAKQHRHTNIHAFPSSIDKQHFMQARQQGDDPQDQQAIGFPRFGFYGVVDERFDIELLREVAALQPDWNFIIIGPVVKIDPATLPQANNIFYLGQKNYAELPLYIRHWNVAMNMFAINEATRYISPTKTPEYLAAGLPVISTPITDVVHPYGNAGLVHIVADAAAFVEAGKTALQQQDKEEWLQQVDDFLADKSWDATQQDMHGLIKKINTTTCTTT